MVLDRRDTFWLEGVEVEVEIRFVQGIGAVVRVGDFLCTVVLMFHNIHGDVHVVMHGLLPVLGLCADTETHEECKK